MVEAPIKQKQWDAEYFCNQKGIYLECIPCGPNGEFKIRMNYPSGKTRHSEQVFPYHARTKAIYDAYERIKEQLEQ